MKPVVITKQNFEEEIMASEVPVLLDFWAPWCGPCRMVSPIIDALSSEVGGKAKIAKVNIDEQPELASKFKVMSIPTLAVVNKGQLTDMKVGARSKQELKAMLGL
ncbi:MAG: thioredoxin [Cellulosilyticaceae bacterium]